MAGLGRLLTSPAGAHRAAGVLSTPMPLATAATVAPAAFITPGQCPLPHRGRTPWVERPDDARTRACDGHDGPVLPPVACPRAHTCGVRQCGLVAGRKRESVFITPPVSAVAGHVPITAVAFAARARARPSGPFGSRRRRVHRAAPIPPSFS